MAKREFFPCYHSYLKKCEKLTDQELGRLFRALLTYSCTGERQELAGRESIAFDFIADDIDRAEETYRVKCEENSKNGKMGGRPKKQSVSKKADGFSKSKDEDKGKDEYKDEDEDISPPTPSRGQKNHTWNTPTFDEVLEETKIRGIPDLARPFFDYYAAAGWRDSEGKPVQSWRQKLVAWKVREDDRLRKQIAAERRKQDGRSGTAGGAQDTGTRLPGVTYL